MSTSEVLERSKQLQLLRLLEELKERKDTNSIDKLFPDTGPLRRELYKKHVDFMNAGATVLERCALAANRCHAEGTLVATPQGPRPIEQIKVGDEVYDRYGNPTKVIKTWDNGEQEVVELTNRNKVWARSTPNHEYLATRVKNSTFNPLTNIEERTLTKHLGRSHLVNRTYVKAPLGNVELKEAYALGAFLGNGCCTEDTRNRIFISSDSLAVVDKVASNLKANYKKQHPTSYSWSFESKGFPLYDLWCRGKYTHEKYVDISVVKTWNRKTALSFIAGLLDTDGSMSWGKDGYSLVFGCQSRSTVDAWSYLILALWNEPTTVCEDSRPKYKNGSVWLAVIRNPHAIKRICKELIPYVQQPKKISINHIKEIGKRSRPEAIYLTHKPIGVFHTYDITVEHEEHFYLLANGLVSSNCGKSEMAAYEVACHAEGRYEPWWQGRRFERPVTIWSAADSYQKTFEAPQLKLMGPVGKWGTGMLRKKSIAKIVKDGDIIKIIYVKHISGGLSTITFKPYQAGRKTFESNNVDIVAADEEIPEDIYDECLLRLTSTVPGTPNGLMILTFTPLQGLTNIAKRFAPNGIPTTGIVEGTNKYCCNIDWDDVPHLSDKTKKELLESIPPYARAARTQGIPSLGAGVVYPVPESSISVGRFVIPATWPKAFAIDAGYNFPAIGWYAKDPNTGVIYMYDCWKQEKELPVVIAEQLKTHGNWIKGVCDPSAPGLMEQLRVYGILSHAANNDVEGGLLVTWQMLNSGKIKIFNDLEQFFMEYRTYHRDTKGKIVKVNDHLVDQLRYLCASNVVFSLPPEPSAPVYITPFRGGWAAR